LSPLYHCVSSSRNASTREDIEKLRGKENIQQKRKEVDREEMGKGTLEVLLVDAKGLADTDFLGKLAV
jgi:hypothetical protein